MRYLVDECLGRLIVSELRDRGDDVAWVRDTAPGMPDDMVLDWSVRDRRVLLTEDFDYGDLIFAQGHPSVGVVILQLSDFPGVMERGRGGSRSAAGRQAGWISRQFDRAWPNAHEVACASCRVM